MHEDSWTSTHRCGHRSLEMPGLLAAARRFLTVWSATTCVGCGEPAPDTICGACVAISGGASCFRPVPYAADRPLDPLVFLGPYAVGGVPTPLARALLRFKYGGDRACGRSLRRLFGDASATLPDAFDLLVPVPLHARRLRQRGYNQAAWLGRGAASRLGLPLDPRALRRVRDTPPQARSGAQARRALADAFFAKPRRVHQRRILLIDDVYTTGATAKDAARALREAGASTVGMAVLLATVLDR